MAMNLYLNRTIKGEVALDGNTFERCIFEECTLLYSGGVPPVLRSNEFRRTEIKFIGSAANTVAFLQTMSRPGSGMQSIVRAALPALTAN